MCFMNVNIVTAMQWYDHTLNDPFKLYMSNRRESFFYWRFHRKSIILQYSFVPEKVSAFTATRMILPLFVPSFHMDFHKCSFKPWTQFKTFKLVQSKTLSLHLESLTNEKILQHFAPFTVKSQMETHAGIIKWDSTCIWLSRSLTLYSDRSILKSGFSNKTSENLFSNNIAASLDRSTWTVLFFLLNIILHWLECNWKIRSCETVSI